MIAIFLAMVKFDELNVFGFTLRTVVHGRKGISRVRYFSAVRDWL